MCKVCKRPLTSAAERGDGIWLPCLLPSDECHACGESALDTALRYNGHITGGNTAVCADGCAA